MQIQPHWYLAGGEKKSSGKPTRKLDLFSNPTAPLQPASPNAATLSVRGPTRAPEGKLYADHGGRRWEFGETGTNNREFEEEGGDSTWGLTA